MVFSTGWRGRSGPISRVRWHQIIRSPANLLAFGFGAGLSPVAPGTVGSLVAIPMIWFFHQMGPTIYLSFTLLVIVAGVWICQKASEDLGIHDHPGIVWDEIAGMLVTFVFVPVTPILLLAGFFLFRVFDVLKPWPVGFADRKVQMVHVRTDGSASTARAFTRGRSTTI